MGELVTANQGQKIMGLAALLGAVAALVGYYGLRGMASRAGDANAGLSAVVVTTTDLTYGQKLERTMLTTVRYPKDAVPAGAYSNIDSVVGQSTKVFLGAREPVTSIKLSSQGGGLSMLVRPSMRAASIEVNQVSGVSGFVLPGDRVDVLVTVEPRSINDNAITKTLLQNVEVLAAGQKTQPKDGSPITVQAVTLLVNPDGAEKVALAQHEGEIHLVLRNPDDQETVELTSFSTREMLGGGSAPAAAAAPSRAVPRTRVAAAPVHRPADVGKVRMIRSAQVTEIPAVADSVGR